MEIDLQTFLQSMGIFQHYCGYPQFILAVALAAENPDRLHNIRREIYIPVARLCHTEVANAEKNSRTVRDVMMRNGGAEFLAALTGSSFWKNKTPYPKELIETFAKYFGTEAQNLSTESRNRDSFEIKF